MLLRTDGTFFWNNTTQWKSTGVGTIAVSGRKVVCWMDGKPVLSMKVQSFPYARFTREGLNALRAAKQETV